VGWSDIAAGKTQLLPELVRDLISCHGVENILGASHWDGFTITEH
jgi:hypothetical protein